MCFVCLWRKSSRLWTYKKSIDINVITQIKGQSVFQFYFSVRSDFFLVYNWRVHCPLLFIAIRFPSNAKNLFDFPSTSMQSYSSSFFRKAVQETLININPFEALVFRNCLALLFDSTGVENIELHSFTALISRVRLDNGIALAYSI